ncbi:MAG: hypothetical protein B6244_01890 [Candidatus Cloacimonetes bacterium 4572_55]|nr:MAG: hypothetical protein B6244_01890 [Candidatus Cloacimonetes bacterium 4572_55]
MAKKWYNYFITVENEPEYPPEIPSDTHAPNSDAAAMPAPKIASKSFEPKITERIEVPNNEPVNFQAIYDAVGIQPVIGGFDVDKIETMLDSDLLKDLSSSVKRNAILVSLEAANVPIEEVIKDAIQRDRALDAYEKVEEKSVTHIEMEKMDENAAIQEEIDQFLEEKRKIIEANNEMVRSAKENFSDWVLRKQQEEQRIYEVVSYFISPNPISTTTNPVVAQQPKPESEPADDTAGA